MEEKFNIDIQVTGLGDLKRQLKEAKDEVIALSNAEVIDPNKLQEATKRAGALKDALNDANEQIAVMSGGSDFEKIASGIGLVGDQLSNLDFEGASKSAKQLTANIQAMNPKNLQKEFGAFIGTVGELSKAFVQMGLKLLANPLFLLVAVVVAVVAAIVMLKDKLKIAEIAFDMMMKPIKLLIQGLKDLTDWIGITSFAEDEAAEKSIAASEKRIAANKKVSDSMAKEYGRQIALAKANGEDTTQLEIQAAKTQQQISADNVKTLNKDIETLVNKQKGKTRTEKEEINKQIQAKRTQRDEELQINKDSANDVKVITAEANKKIADEKTKANQKTKSDNQKAEAERIESLKRAYEVERAANQATIALMDEGLEKELAINAEKKRVQEQDLQFTKYTEQQKLVLRKTFQTEKEIADKAAIEKDKQLKKQAQEKEEADLKDSQERLKNYKQKYADYILEKTGTDLQKEVATIEKGRDEQLAIEQQRFFNELSNLKLTQEQKEKLEKEHQARIKKIKGIADDEIKQATAKSAGEEIADVINKYTEIAEKVMEGVDAINGFLNQQDSNRLNAIDSRYKAEVSSLEEKQAKELSVQGLSESQKQAINDKYEKLKYQAELKAFNDSEKIKKKQFARDKALRMAGVVIDTAKAISGAVAKSPETFGMPWAAVAGAIGAIQLATIASQKYEGESGPSAPSVGNTGSNGSSAPVTPTTQLTGNSTNFNETRQGQAVEAISQPTFTVRAIVSETEMTDAQSRVSRMQRSAEL